MHIIKLDAIDSTNSYLRNLYSNGRVKDFTVVMASKQKKGRGQMGTVWYSERGKNLLFSVFKDLSNVHLDNSFFISMIMSLSIVKALKEFNIPNIRVKWPNDILSDSDKICGILIENVIKNNELMSCLIGVGLNVNQTNFKNVPRATSLKLTSGVTYDLDEMLHKIIQSFKSYCKRLDKNGYSNLKEEYESYLFRKNKPSTFKDVEGKMFTGYIEGVNKSGKLKVLIEDDIIKKFDLKEITLLY